MPRKTKDATPGRVTPKGGPPKRVRPGAGATPSQPSTGRYTAPIPKEFKVSPWWVPALIIAFFACGVGMILLNYLGLLGTTSNVYLFIGLGLIVGGFVTSTRWH